MKHPERGFSVIEAFVVLAIIGLLSGTAYVVMKGARARDRDAARVADVKRIQGALEAFFADAHGYPYEGGTHVTLGDGGNRALCRRLDASDAATSVAESSFKGACAAGESTYLAAVPAAPLPTDGGCSSTTNNYTYAATGGSGTSLATTYQISFCLGGEVGDLGSGMRTAGPAGIQ